MNRKLHNTLSALTASGALLVVSLIAAAPMPGQSTPAFAGTTPAATELTAAIVLVGALETAAAQTIESSSTDTMRSAGTTTRNRRQTSVMPYFSFMPRG